MLSVSPLNSDGDVAIRPTISVAFSEAMNQAAAQGAFSIDPAVSGTFSWNGNTMIYTPDTDLPYSVTYTANVGTGAKDAAGNGLASAYSWSFTIRNAPDTTPPTIITVSPVDGSLRVPLSSPLSITFSEAMDQASVEAAFSGNPALPAGTFSWTGNTMTFTPGTAMGEFTPYTITVGTGAKDLEGNSLAAPLTFSWKTALLHRIISLTSAFGDNPTSNGGIFPSADGEYIWWWDGTSSEGPGDNFHLYRVKLSDLTSSTVWPNRSVWGSLFDDGTSTWVGNYGPYTAAGISNASLDYLVRDLSLGHTVGLSGNIPSSDYVYFSTTNWGTPAISYWKKSNNTSGYVTSVPGGYVRQSAVIGNKIYFPLDYPPYGIMVIDTAINPTILQTTLLSGNGTLAGSGDICADNTYLYVRNAANQILKIDPSGTGSVVYSFLPGAQLVNPVVIGDYIYSGSATDKYVYIINKNTWAMVKKDCSAYLPFTVGTPKWDFANDGIWYGPQNNIATNNRVAYFISRSLIGSCPDVP